MALSSPIFCKSARTYISVLFVLTHFILLVGAPRKRPATGPSTPVINKKPNVPRNTPICDEPACWSLGSDIKQNINPDVNPCDDFYKFVCGNWENKFPHIKKKPFYTQFERAKDTITAQIKEILEEEPRNEILALKKAKIWHKTCMDDETLRRRGLEPIKETLQKLGGWPIILPNWTPKEWQDIDHYYTIYRLGASAFFKIQIIPDLQNQTERRILKLTPPQFLLPEYVLMRSNRHQADILAYNNFINTVLGNFIPSTGTRINPQSILTDIVDMMILEMQLTKAANPVTPNPATRTTRMKISEFSKLFLLHQRNQKINKGIFLLHLYQLHVIPEQFFETVKEHKRNRLKKHIKMTRAEHLAKKIWKDMLQVNAAYQIDANVLTVYAPLLAPPFFVSGNSKMLQLYNYGSVGFIITHENGHAFDDSGKQYPI
ncbi:membrane metallo-endopeptidase-like 1 [Orussus abietinus]|uniref:membrane metallo-endopeptidase-like 1 n=1 Tax=Orussus abietinus TaxID=222816 RepID=UPI000C715D42|nr:membrane metallo-endopeptidase-like 1 [Orussus abietinus]